MTEINKWESGIEPAYPNPFLTDDPLDYKRLQHLHREMDTGWRDWIDEETKEPDSERQKQAIANAYRVALLARDGKSLKDVATHYQDIMHIPYTVSDPKIYDDTLRSARIHHNRADGHPYPDLVLHHEALKDFYRYVQSMHPHLSPVEARKLADRMANAIQYEIEDKLHREDPTKHFDEKKVQKALEKRLKQFAKMKKTTADSDIPPGTYAPFSQRSLFGLSNASRYIDDITADMLHSKDDLSGHQYRERALDSKIPGIGPKEHSMAWYLLHPTTSDLAIVDPSTLEALDSKDKDYKERDYLLYERLLQAARDASGYGFMPLSQFQKGLIDYYYGPSDITSLRPWNPTPYHKIEFPQEAGYQEWPEWLQESEPYRNQIDEDWNLHVAPRYPTHQAPKFSYSHQGNNLFLEIPEAVKNRIYSWALYHFDNPLKKDEYKVSVASFDSPQDLKLVNLEGMKLQAPCLIKQGNFVGLLFDLQKDHLDYISSHKGTSCKVFVPIAPSQNIEKVEAPPISFRCYTSATMEPSWHLATVGPEVTNEISDPLANNPADPISAPGEAPTQAWKDHDGEFCTYCENKQIIEMNGNKVVCPVCSQWPTDRKRFRSGPGNDPATDNPEPGQLNETLLYHGP